MKTENLFSLLELIPDLNVLSRKSFNAFMHFAVESGSPTAVVGYRFSGGSHEAHCMMIGF